MDTLHRQRNTGATDRSYLPSWRRNELNIQEVRERTWNTKFRHMQSLRELLLPLSEEMIERGAEPEDILFDVHRLCPAKSKSVQTPVMQTVRSFFRRLSRECCFHVSPHRFRHTLATLLMKHPERNMQLTRQMLGHRSLASTLEYIGLDTHSTTAMLESELSDYLKMGLRGEHQRLTKK